MRSSEQIVVRVRKYFVSFGSKCGTIERFTFSARKSVGLLLLLMMPMQIKLRNIISP